MGHPRWVAWLKIKLYLNCEEWILLVNVQLLLIMFLHLVTVILQSSVSPLCQHVAF